MRAVLSVPVSEFIKQYGIHNNYSIIMNDSNDEKLGYSSGAYLLWGSADEMKNLRNMIVVNYGTDQGGKCVKLRVMEPEPEITSRCTDADAKPTVGEILNTIGDNTYVEISEPDGSRIAQGSKQMHWYIYQLGDGNRHPELLSSITNRIVDEMAVGHSAIYIAVQ